MPFYMHCPHCTHPHVVPQHRRGRTQFCRQCGKAYITSKQAELVYPSEINSLADLHARSRQPNKQNVYVLVA